MSEHPPFPWLRASLFVGLCGAMLVGPISNQVFGQHYHRFFKPWRMYFGYGTELCEVTYVQLAKDGQQRELDRYDLLGHRKWFRAPASVRHLPDGPTIGRIGKQMCEALPVRKPDVRARARCASIRGWQPAMDLEQNLCTLGPRQIEGLRPKAGKRR